MSYYYHCVVNMYRIKMSTSSSIALVHTQFRCPSTTLVCGASGSGKTTFIYNVLRYKHLVIANGANISNILYFYNTWQPLYDRMKQEGLVTTWINAAPTSRQLEDLTAHFRNGPGSICIIDDFLTNISKDIMEIFTIVSHHNKICVFLLSQCIFPKNPYFRELSINAKYIVLHKNPRENAQVEYLARQINPRKKNIFIQAFQAATQAPYSYIIFNLHQETPDHLRIQARIFPHEWTNDQEPFTIYLPD